MTTAIEYFVVGPDQPYPYNQPADHWTLTTSGVEDSTGAVFNGDWSFMVDSGGSAISCTIDASCNVGLWAGSTASGMIILSGGFENVWAGATDTGAQISGGQQFVSGSAISATVYAGGSQVVESGGTASDTTINGGTLELGSGSVAADTIYFAGSGGAVKIDAAIMPTATISGFAPSDTIDLAAVTFDSNGSATLDAGNVLAVTADGQTYDLNLDPSQNLVGYGFQLSPDPSGGTDIALVAPLMSTGTVSSGLIVNDLSVNSGAFLTVNGTANNTLVNGTVLVQAQGLLKNTKVAPGGNVNVSGGTASGTNVNGGTQTLLAGAKAVYTIVNKGQEIVNAATATATDTVVSSVGQQNVIHGSVLATKLVSGGTQIVSGTASGTVVNDGSSALVEQGGILINPVVNSGGTVTLDPGAVLYLSSSSTPNGVTVKAGAIVATAATYPNYIQLPADSSGNLGREGPNGGTVINANLTSGVTFSAGNGPAVIIAGQNDNIYGGNSTQTLIGANGATLHAGNGVQTLYGAPNETMIGSKGGQDTFVFEPGFGLDNIKNFNTNDFLQFNPSLFASYAAMMNTPGAITQSGADTVINDHKGDTVTLLGVAASALKQSNFTFA